MDRALSEFRIRGVKTNIPFLENVILHPQFRSGQATTTLIDTTPELFAFRSRKDRATKLLNFLGNVIVNGNPHAKGYSPSKPFDLPVVPADDRRHALPKGTRDLLLELGPKKFAEWALKQKRLLVTDTTFRDAHQSLMATRVRTYDMLACADALASRHGDARDDLFSLEMWGGATFDTAMRFLNEDPWERLRQLRAKVPNICFQMLFRGSNALWVLDSLSFCVMSDADDDVPRDVEMGVCWWVECAGLCFTTRRQDEYSKVFRPAAC